VSLRTIGYENGRPIKADEGPSYARLPGHGGALVVGDPRSDSKSRALDAAARHREKRRQSEPSL